MVLRTPHVLFSRAAVLSELDILIKHPGLEPSDMALFPTGKVIGPADVGGTLIEILGEIPTRTAETSCLVCFDEFEPDAEVLRLSCGHVYHTECITRWLRTTTRCPVDRQELV